MIHDVFEKSWITDNKNPQGIVWRYSRYRITDLGGLNKISEIELEIRRKLGRFSPGAQLRVLDSYEEDGKVYWYYIIVERNNWARDDFVEKTYIKYRENDGNFPIKSKALLDLFELARKKGLTKIDKEKLEY